MEKRAFIRQIFKDINNKTIYIRKKLILGPNIYFYLNVKGQQGDDPLNFEM